jgi:hypothetical protein
MVAESYINTHPSTIEASFPIFCKKNQGISNSKLNGLSLQTVLAINLL